MPRQKRSWQVPLTRKEVERTSAEHIKQARMVDQTVDVKAIRKQHEKVARMVEVKAKRRGQ